MNQVDKNSVQLRLLDVHCASCVSTIDKVLAKQATIESYQVNFANRTVTVRGDLTAIKIIELIKQAGYKSEEMVSGESSHTPHKPQRFIWLQSLLAGVWGITLIILALTGVMPNLFTIGGMIYAISLGCVTFIIMMLSGYRYYISALKSLWHGQTTMDTLIMLGTSTAWIYSMLVITMPSMFVPQARHLYFDASVIILCFITLGSAIEQRSMKKASASIDAFMKLTPKMAHLIKQGEESTVSLSEIRVGDILRVKPGELVPLDGMVMDGESYIDESLLTGEPIAVTKFPGDTVIGGSLNQTGSLSFQVTKVKQDGVLADIIKHVEDAQNTKPRIAKLADQVVGFFVPVVIIIALLTGVIWFLLGYSVSFSITTAISVCVIACPCALGLAVPMAVMVAVGRAAGRGILISNAEILQRATKITHMIFDKTGTVTEGHPEVCDVNIVGETEDRFWSYVSSVEQLSEHPLAGSLLKASHQFNLTQLAIESFQAIPGKGVIALCESKNIAVGNDILMIDQGVDISLCMEARVWQQQAKTLVYVALNKTLIGLIAINDPIKAGVRETIAELQQRDIHITLLTGDQQQPAKLVAESLGIDQVVAGVMPQEKQHIVKKIQEQSAIVAMVGDGINDAPALAQADVGCAMASGSDIAILSADISILSHSLQDIVHVIDLSKATVSVIKQNLWGALIYNAVAIPIAAGVLYPLTGILLNPMIASAAMALSSLTVVFNSYRLYRRHI